MNELGQGESRPPFLDLWDMARASTIEGLGGERDPLNSWLHSPGCQPLQPRAQGMQDGVGWALVAALGKTLYPLTVS